MANLNVSYYANPKFSFEQMRFIKTALTNKEKVALFAQPELTLEEMKVVSCYVKNHVNIVKLAQKMNELDE